jgi:polyisoprenoid-binding protein YceI
MSAPKGRRRWRRWIVAGVALVVVLAVGGPFVYIHFIEGPAPAKLALSTTPAPGAALTGAEIDGTWTVGSGSQAGYRVQEVLAGQNNTAVGRTRSVTGSVKISRSQVAAASFVVDLRTVASDQSQRDQQFNGRIMDTQQFPNATFTLTKPISLGQTLRVNQTINVQAVGTLAMHGVTKPVTAMMQARDTGSTIEVSGQIPVVFANWDIANPSFGSFVTTKNNGLVEFLLHTSKS